MPSCQVSIQIDQGDPEAVGFQTPKEALEAYLTDQMVPGRKSKLKVVQREVGGLALAYAVDWSEYFQEWNFVGSRDTIDQPGSFNLPLGICIEGVRITESTPGFDSATIYAIANFTGPSAPKTDVARSSLEQGDSLTAALISIYSLYLAHVEEEIRGLRTERQFSITWAAREVRFLMQSLFPEDRSGRAVSDLAACLSALRQFQGLLVEIDETRTMTSAQALSSYDGFWMVDSQSFNSIESLLSELPRDLSMNSLSTGINSVVFDTANNPLLCSTNLPAMVEMCVFRDREVGEIRLNPRERRIDLKWIERAASPIWIQPGVDWPKRSPRYLDLYLDQSDSSAGYMVQLSRRQLPSFILLSDFSVTGGENIDAVIAFDRCYFLQSPIQEFFLYSHDKIKAGSSCDSVWIALDFCVAAASGNIRQDSQRVWRDKWAAAILALDEHFDNDRFLDALGRMTWRRFSTSLWTR